MKKLHDELPLEEQLSALLRISLSLPGNVHALNILRQQNGEHQTYLCKQLQLAAKCFQSVWVMYLSRAGCRA